MRPLPPSEEYGTIRLDRLSTANGQKPVVFPHWLHRLYFTCEVCHTELEMEMEAGASEISEETIAQGRHCGACHNGVRAFARKDNCRFCHGGDAERNRLRFGQLYKVRGYPSTSYGNHFDWVTALSRGMIKPVRSLEDGYQPMRFDRDLLLKAEWGGISPAVFSHKVHLEWMDCNMCHPMPFNLKLKGTQHFRMAAILEGEFCGACHLNVAFPMDDCQRCHPDMDS